MPIQMKIRKNQLHVVHLLCKHSNMKVMWEIEWADVDLEIQDLGIHFLGINETIDMDCGYGG